MTTPKIHEKEYWDIDDGLLFTIFPENSDNFATHLWDSKVVIYYETSSHDTWVGATSLLSDLDELLPKINIGCITDASIVHHPKATYSALEIVATIKKKIPQAKIVQAEAIRAYPSLSVIQQAELEGEWTDTLIFPPLVKFFPTNHFLACSFGRNSRNPNIRKVTRNTTLYESYETLVKKYTF